MPPLDKCDQGVNEAHQQYLRQPAHLRPVAGRSRTEIRCIGLPLSLVLRYVQ